MKKIRLYEMFAGYGGARHALELANIPYESVGYSEIKPHAIKIYGNNFKDDKNFGDCTKINTDDLEDFDLLCGGFPCQDVSMAGARDLSKERTNLFKEVIRIANVKKPKYMLLENVRGILSMNNGNYFREIISEINKIGYDVCWKVLNSKNHNNPQNRERVWIVCKRGKFKFMEFLFPIEETQTLFLKDVLDKTVDKKYYYTDEKWERLERLNKTRYGTHIKSINAKYSSCICSIGKTDVLNIREEKRVLTPTECFRLMGFINKPINLEGLSDNKLYNLAGDGWDINVASKIFKRLFKENLK